MGKKLARTVVVDGVTYPAGTDLPDGVQVDNPRAFEDDALPTPLEQIEADQKAARIRRDEQEKSARADSGEKATAASASARTRKG